MATDPDDALAAALSAHVEDARAVFDEASSLGLTTADAVKLMLGNIESGRFTAEHYTTMWRARIAEHKRAAAAEIKREAEERAGKTMAALKRRGTQPLSETSLDIGERLPSMSTASKANSRKTSLASVSIEIPDVEHSTGSSDGEDSPVEQSAAAAFASRKQHQPPTQQNMARLGPALAAVLDPKSPLRVGSSKEFDAKRFLEVLSKCSEADVNWASDDGTRPLHWLVMLDRPKLCAALIERRADVDAVDRRGDSALIMAAISNLPKTAEVLLQHGADRALRAKDGRTASDCARQEGLFAMETLVRPTARQSSLSLEAGAAPLDRDDARERGSGNLTRRNTTAHYSAPSSKPRKGENCLNAICCDIF